MLIDAFLHNPHRLNLSEIIEHMRQRERIEEHLEFEKYLLIRIKSIDETERNLEELREIVEKLTTPPYHHGIFTGYASNGQCRAVVSTGGAHKIEIPLNAEISTEDLRIGDAVAINSDSTCILENRGAYVWGELAEFERRLPDGRLLLVARGEERIVVSPTESISDTENIPTGAEIRFDRASSLAFEVIDCDKNDCDVDDFPSVSFEEIGGLQEQIEQIEDLIFDPMNMPELYASYKFRMPVGIVLAGPPGSGKTLLVHAIRGKLFSMLRERGIEHPGQHYIQMSVGNTLSEYVSIAERRIARTFRKARNASRSTGLPVIIFLDEADALLNTRGSRRSSDVDQTIVPAFLEAIGKLDTKDNKVVVIAATNLVDSLDSAIQRPGRLGDCQIRMPHPDRTSAEEILRIYLTTDLPYSRTDGRCPAEIVENLIETAISYIYPATKEDNSYGTILFRDGTRRPITAAALFTGAVARQIRDVSATYARSRKKRLLKLCDGAIDVPSRFAGDFGSMIETDGITSGDLLQAIDEVMTAIVRNLTPQNIQRQIYSLPTDSDIISVEPLILERGHKYLNQPATA